MAALKDFIATFVSVVPFPGNCFPCQAFKCTTPRRNSAAAQNL